MHKSITLLISAVVCLVTVQALAGASDKDFSDYQGDVDKALQAVLGELSPAGQKSLKDTQKRWANFVNEYCDPEVLDWHYNSADDCKNKYYANRAKELESAVVKTAEGLVFRREEYFSTHMVDVSQNLEDGTPKYRTETRYGWPQIDNPVSDAQRAWNKLMSEKHPRDEPVEGKYCDDRSDYEIGLTSPDFISIKLNDSMYCHGAAHGFGGTRIVNRILSENRGIVSNDIFRDDTGWKNVLEKLSIESFEDQGKDEADYSRLKNEIANTTSWSILSDGLYINFGELNGYAQGEYIAKISWQELKPYLADKSSVMTAIHSAISD